jgi:large subunit ribosomal protein L13
MKTYSPSARDIERSWYVVDVEGLTLGRVATRIATVLRGKHKPTYTPHLDCGDYVIVVNADKVLLNGEEKTAQKEYFRHSGYPGGIKSIPFTRLMARSPEKVVEKAVAGMLPKSKLGHAMIRKLKVYAGPEHPHAAQQPQPLQLDAKDAR